MNESKIIGFCILAIILLLFLGIPDEVNILGAKWSLKDSVNEIATVPTPTPHLTAQNMLSIEMLKPRQQIYGLNENATADFTIKDEYNIPYKFSVIWYYDNEKYHGWDDGSNISKDFYSWYPVNLKGEWKVQVVLKWEYLNQTYSKDSLTYLEVI